MIRSEISKAIATPRKALLEHPVYRQLQSVEQMRLFMEFHVFAVWDFMSLLKALQQNLTCVGTPWLPSGDARIRRQVNEIVLGEESDVMPDGRAASHFELYLKAMEQAGADTRPVLRFIELLRAGSTLEQALETVSPPDSVKAFVRHTFAVIDGGKPHEIAAAFTYGREDLIPDMFGALVTQLQRDFPGRFETFRFYLDRHIELDGDEHGEMGRQMVALLCGGNAQKERESAAAAKAALQARLNLWDGIAARLAEAGPLPERTDDQNDGITRLFSSSWSLYDAIVEANYMAHREIHAVVLEVADAMAKRGAYSLLDLGCGNARGLARALRACPPARYLGVDLSHPALAEAAIRLAGLLGVELREEDMLATVQELVNRGDKFDLVYSGFAMHHLLSAEKARLFGSLSRLLTPGGVLLLVDVVREAGESREQYLETYLSMVRTEWSLLDAAQVEEVCEHIAKHDFPESWAGLVAMAQAAGFGMNRTLAKYRQHWVMQFSQPSSNVVMP